MPDFSWVRKMKPLFVQLSQDMDKKVTVETLQKKGGEPFKPLEFYRTERALYIGEAGIKDKDLVFHFFAYPQTGFPGSLKTKKPFDDVMGDAFEKVFKHLDRVEAAYSDELKSWAVRVRGYADSIGVEMLRDRLFQTLDELLVS